ncbi:hypothetical protein [Fibrella forsythiae]|uniref:DUF4476 domain-containing protein n=1 Tax=Fibrella forsythiae TaxID=2817061 RepID=A0ABS3JDN3_9BACT|nr:hypothetical protein [Fibrella forsythiae]MBO0946997.1 hypothetical protein [Fibrella forsythiae]
MPKDLWKWIVGVVGLLVAMYWLAYASKKSQVQNSSRCADRLDLPNKGATMGAFTPLQAANLAKECNDVFDAWISTGYGQDVMVDKLMALTNDQLFATMSVYDSTYKPGLIAEIEDDYTYMIPQYITSGKASDLVKRLKALQSGVK